MHFPEYEILFVCRTSISKKSQTSPNFLSIQVRNKISKSITVKSALLFDIQKRGFQYRYCFEFLQGVLFILIQAMQKYKIIKTFFINYCVLDLSKICINSSGPSFQLVEDIINSLRVQHIQNIPQVLHQHHNNCSIFHKVLFLGICGIYL